MHTTGSLGSINSKLFGPDVLQGIVYLFSKRQTSFYKSLVNTVIDTKQKYVEFTQVGDFGMAPVIAEGTKIGYDDFDVPYTKQYFPQKRAMGFYVTEEAMESDRYMVVRNGKAMAYAFNKTLEQVVANYLFNNATSAASAYVGEDGVALASDAHPLAAGVYDNLTADVFGPITLETAIQTLAGQKSHRGDPMPSMGPFDLVTGVGLMGLANRVTKAGGLQGTPDHDPNWGGNQITSYTANPYITSATAWMLKSKDWKSALIVKRALSAKSQEDIDYDAVKYVSTTIYLPIYTDWREVQFSTGA